MYECAARRGLTVGKDVSIVGVDNHRVFAETLEPQLTTVELPHYEYGLLGPHASLFDDRTQARRQFVLAEYHRSHAAVGFADSCEDPLRADRKGIGSQLSFAI